MVVGSLSVRGGNGYMAGTRINPSRSVVSPFEKTAGMMARPRFREVHESMIEYEPEDDSSDVPCPSCGSEYGSVMAMKVHHSKTHGESIAGIDVSCAYCGAEKTVIPARYEKQDRFFCNPECQGEWRAENRVGEDNPLWEGGTVECANCGAEKELPGYQYGRHEKTFCGPECQGEWQSENSVGANNPNWVGRVTVECAHCGTEKQIREKEYERSERFFCDIDCRGKWRSEHVVGENHPLWDGGPVDVECSRCGAGKQVTNYEHETQEHFFCDSECLGEWMAENRSGENSWAWEGGDADVQCAYCGNPKTVRRTRYENQDRFFCGPDCQGEWIAENLTGEDHPLWKGGKPRYYGENWHRQRRACLNRDDHCCQVCGKSDNELERSLDVHHIRPIIQFDEPENANFLDNLICLCRGCHMDWEGIPLRPQVVRT